MIFKNVLLYTLVVHALVACSNEPEDLATSDTDDKISHIQEDNKDIKKAIAKAKSTFANFKKILEESQNNPKFEEFSIRMGFNSCKFSKEQMWLTGLKLEGNTLKGVLNSIPEDKAITYKYGDTITINQNEISDWMYLEVVNDNLEITHGAYTLRAIRDKMSPKERARFDYETGLKFTD